MRRIRIKENTQTALAIQTKNPNYSKEFYECDLAATRANTEMQFKIVYRLISGQDFMLTTKFLLANTNIFDQKFWFGCSIKGGRQSAAKIVPKTYLYAYIPRKGGDASVRVAGFAGSVSCAASRGSEAVSTYSGALPCCQSRQLRRKRSGGPRMTIVATRHPALPLLRTETKQVARLRAAHPALLQRPCQADRCRIGPH